MELDQKPNGVLVIPEYLRVLMLKVEGAQGTRSREFLIGPNAGNIRV